jgi:drug/metabolite transporter (DMT)-like permease
LIFTFDRAIVDIMKRRVRAHHALFPDLALLGIAAIWGGSYLATQELAASSSAAAVLCARFLPAAALLLVLHRLRRAGSLRGSLRAGSLLGVLRAATITLETIGVTLTSATNAGLIIGLSILLTPLLESLATRRRLTASLLGSVVLALGGIALLVGGDGLARMNPGDGLILLAAVTRALLGVAEARVTAHDSADVTALTTVEIVFGAVLFTLWGGGSLFAHAPAFSPTDWALLIYLSLGCTVLAFLGQLWATRRTSASRAGMLLGSEPGWALLIGVAIGGERIGVTGFIGAGVLIVALLWGRRAEQRWRDGAEQLERSRTAA